MNDFTFYSPTKFIFGREAIDALGGELSKRSFRKALIVYGGASAVKSGVLKRVKESLDANGVAYEEMGGVRPNPELQQVRAGIELLRSSKCDCLLPVGGGSVIDCAKAIAFGADYDGDVWDFFDGKAKITKCLPIAVVLTLPAAGSEGSASCVISNDAVSAKRGVGADCIRPILAFMDPETTFSLPPYQTAAGVTDMIAHICERYFSGQGPALVTDALATSLVRTLIASAPKALADPRDYEARAAIMWAGTLAHNDLVGCGRASSAKTRAGGWESHALEHELIGGEAVIVLGIGYSSLERLVEEVVVMSLSTQIPTITEGGKYRIVVESEAGVQKEFHFVRKHVMNTAGSIFILVVIGLSVIGLFTGLVYRNKSKTDD
mgnify:CR=1 FL=1